MSKNKEINYNETLETKIEKKKINAQLIDVEFDENFDMLSTVEKLEEKKGKFLEKAKNNENYGNKKCPMCKSQLIKKYNEITTKTYIRCSNFPDCKYLNYLNTLSKNFSILKKFEEKFFKNKNNLHLERLFYEINTIEANIKFNEIDEFYIRIRKCLEISFVIFEQMIEILYSIKPTDVNGSYNKEYFINVLNKVKATLLKRKTQELELNDKFDQMNKISLELYKIGNKGAHVSKIDPWLDVFLSKDQKINILKRLHTFFVKIHSLFYDTDWKEIFSFDELIY